MSNDTNRSSKLPLEFKSTSLNVPALVLFSTDLEQITEQIAAKVAQAPEFFKYSPLMIDLQSLKHPAELDVTALISLLRAHLLLPVGIRGGTEPQNSEAQALGVPVLSAHGQTTALNIEPKQTSPAKPSAVEEAAVTTTIENKLVTQPVRSGQRVYAKGDLIVTATVSAGAEIMAEGNIHIYGSLRGRALAGVLGDPDSRIFCSDLQAELISIAGIYKLSDDLDKTTRGKPVQISLQDQTLLIKPL